jgi:deoxyribose-phosphate aldolase
MYDFSHSPEINPEEVQNKINKIINAEIAGYSKLEAYKFILSIIDLTTLEGSDTNQRVIDLCNKAKTFSAKGNNIPNTAAVCVYPPLVSIAKRELKGTGIHVASVAGAFPSGQSPIKVKLAEIKYAIEEGADEIDMVISRGKFLQGEYNIVFDEIAAIKDLCGKTHLKVILETGELGSLTNIRRASEIAMQAGGDFIKTSTGKINPAATLEAMFVMLEAINDFHKSTNKKIGIKPAGSISEPPVALNFIKLTNAVLGKEWMNKDLFRLGASRLADKVLEEILKA